jgi:hypothetical protein
MPMSRAIPGRWPELPPTADVSSPSSSITYRYHLQTSQDLVAGSAGDRLLIEFVFAALWGDAQSAPTGEEND